MRFDWYAATVREDPDLLVATLADRLGSTVEKVHGLHGYTYGHEFRREGDVVARALSGGRNGNPHVWASGDDTDQLVAIIRECWPSVHRVSRMDAAEDFDGAGTWDRLYGVLLQLADERNLKIDQAGDWHRGVAGRTFYVGGRKSAVFARLYEKGKQLRGLALDGGDDISPDLVRLEIQVRPEGRARDAAAAGTPEGAYGYADWTVELGRRVLGLDVERVRIKERRETDDERAIEWAVRQYGEHLERLAGAVGGWDLVGPELARVRARQLKRRDS